MKKSTHLFRQFLKWRYKNISNKYFVQLISILIGFLAGLTAVTLKNITYFIEALLENGIILSENQLYFILPIVMAVTMFIQMRLNPAPPDPLQAKIMMFMPIVFSIFFFFFPSGLVLYWLVNNVVSIAQQWSIMRKLNVRAG